MRVTPRMAAGNLTSNQKGGWAGEQAVLKGGRGNAGAHVQGKVRPGVNRPAGAILLRYSSAELHHTKAAQRHPFILALWQEPSVRRLNTG